MRIRTKLLWALGSISLIPPIAAYVSLIDNPRISFALRMNESEARQGTLAQQLQSDLSAIRSAVEESLSETYRIQVEPKQRGDAERQRRLANSTVQSAVAAFERDLDTITQSTAQQAKETLAVGEAPDAVDQRETQLLKELHELFPDLKSSAEKFAKLSDGYSPAEGDFVQEVFEPEVGEKLGRIVQELASEADRGAEEDRRKHRTGAKTFLQAIHSRGSFRSGRERRPGSGHLSCSHRPNSKASGCGTPTRSGENGHENFHSFEGRTWRTCRFLQFDGRQPYEAHEGARPGAG
jgi:hypothetical protein